MDPAQVLSALPGVAAVVGIGLGLLQLRRLTKQRQLEIVLRVYAPFLDPAFSRAYWQVNTWSYSSFEEFDANATLDDRAALNVVRILFETMGLLYKRGFASIDFLADLLASPTITTWNKIEPIMHGYRAKANAPDWSRWHEELAVALDERLTKLGRQHAAVQPRTGSRPGRTAEQAGGQA